MLTVVIQAGGESRRMGQSKATVPFLGKPLILRLIKRLRDVADELVITTNEPEKLDFLQDMVDSGELRLQPDLLETRGALNGLYTAFASATEPYVALVACDMIFASANLISAELEALRQNDEANAAVPITSHGFEPFHAVYKREETLAIVEELIASGARSAQSCAYASNIIEFTTEMVLAAEPRGGCFLNANTPEELAAIENRILAHEMTTIDASGKDD